MRGSIPRHSRKEKEKTRREGDHGKGHRVHFAMERHETKGSKALMHERLAVSP